MCQHFGEVVFLLSNGYFVKGSSILCPGFDIQRLGNYKVTWLGWFNVTAKLIVCSNKLN